MFDSQSLTQKSSNYCIMILRPNLFFTMKMNSLDTKFITKLFKDTIFFKMLRNFISNAHLNYFIHLFHIYQVSGSSLHTLNQLANLIFTTTLKSSFISHITDEERLSDYGISLRSISPVMLAYSGNQCLPHRQPQTKAKHI